MANEAYAAAVMAMGLYGGLLQDVMREYGWEKAREMHAKRGWAMGLSGGFDHDQICGLCETLDSQRVPSRPDGGSHREGQPHQFKKTPDSTCREQWEVR